VNLSLTPKEQDMNDNLDLFLMAICHQPYSELVLISLDKRTRLLKCFQKIVEQLFNSKGSKKDILNVIKGITDPNEYIAQQKAKEHERS
jgi:hypothetical protein